MNTATDPEVGWLLKKKVNKLRKKKKIHEMKEQKRSQLKYFWLEIAKMAAGKKENPKRHGKPSLINIAGVACS